MTRESWIYPSDGSPPYRKGTLVEDRTKGGVVILSDLPDFVSPIDGKVYSGRRGLREHCERHNVVPTADLKGLPYLQYNSDTRSSDQKRQDAEQRKRLIIDSVTTEYRKYNG